MYTAFQLAKKYINYYFRASNGKGHGVHSPFVFDFIEKVLLDKRKYEDYIPIEKRRTQLLRDRNIIEIEDFGAGSAMLPFKTRIVGDTARISLKNKKYSQLLYRMVNYFGSKNILELGTSFGITTSYLAKATKGTVNTFEGATSIANIARKTFDELGVLNVQITEGDFSKTFQQKLMQIGATDFAFLDGNHRKQPTLDYFNLLKSHINEMSVLIFDDIHWSKEMEEAWEIIKKDVQVTLSIDLFFIGIVFFRKDFKVKQHFSIRF